jgi:anti-sigma factor RsiW
MQCKKVIRRFSAYIDGELTFEEEALIEQHLNGCSNCRAEYFKLRSTLDLMAQLPEEDPGDEFSRAVMNRIREERAEVDVGRSTPWRERWSRWVQALPALRPAYGMAAALVFGIMVGAAIYETLGGGFMNPARSTPRGAGQAVVERTAPEGSGFAAGAAAEEPGVGTTDLAESEASDMVQEPDSIASSRPEFVLDHYIMEDELRQVAVPLYPREIIDVREVSPKDDTITF